MKVLWIFRQPVKGVFSIENLFSSLEPEIRKVVDLHIYKYDRAKSLISNVRRIKSYRADIYHITGSVNFLALFLPRKQTIITVHDIDHYQLTLKGIKRIIFGILWWHLPLRKARITCISEFSKEKLVAHFRLADDRIKVIPNCVNAHFQRIPEIDRMKGRILQVGTKKNKNLERVIQALDGIDCTLVIIGRLSNEQLHLLRKHQLLFENLIDINIDELVHQYNMASLVTFISTSEGFGLPILESQATETPIITSNIEPMKSIAGWIEGVVDPYNIDDIRKIIERVLSEPGYVNRMVKLGKENVENYTCSKVASSYYQLYKSV